MNNPNVKPYTLTWWRLLLIMLPVYGLLIANLCIPHTVEVYIPSIEPTETVEPMESEEVTSDTTGTNEQPAVTTSPTEPSTEPTTEPTVTPVLTPTEPVNTNLYFDVPLSDSLQDHIFALCEDYDLDPAMVVAVIYRESSYRATAIGDGGKSFGLMQIQPRWHQRRMDRLGCQDLLDPFQNVTVGIDYLASLAKGGKPIEYILMGYNGGPDYAERKMEEGVVSEYARNVMATMQTLKRRSE